MRDRAYVSAPRRILRVEEATKRVFANIAQEEVSAVNGIFGSTRAEVGGSEAGVWSIYSGKRLCAAITRICVFEWGGAERTLDKVIVYNNKKIHPLLRSP